MAGKDRCKGSIECESRFVERSHGTLRQRIRHSCLEISIPMRRLGHDLASGQFHLTLLIDDQYGP